MFRILRIVVPNLTAASERGLTGKAMIGSTLENLLVAKW
jgi:hypothetical protein